jgi:hypothetical protein
MILLRANLWYAFAGLSLISGLNFAPPIAHSQTIQHRVPERSGRDWLVEKFASDPEIGPFLRRTHSLPPPVDHAGSVKESVEYVPSGPASQSYQPPVTYSAPTDFSPYSPTHQIQPTYSQPTYSQPTYSQPTYSPATYSPATYSPAVSDASVRQVLQWRVRSGLHHHGVFPQLEPPVLVMTPELRRSLEHPVVQQVCQQIDNANWPNVVREATKSFTIRSMNAKSLADRAEVPASVREAVRDAIVGEINRSAGNRERLEFFGDAIEAGVEDAIVEAFNLTAANNLAPGNVQVADPTAASNECLRINVVGGCIVVDNEIIPLAADGSYQLIQRSQDSPSFELWRDGRQVFASCLFAQYYREAMKLRDKYFHFDQQQ